MRHRPVHPFPARMAPEIVIQKCTNLAEGSIVLDPMCGSGTTLRVAIEHGIAAIGSDIDPLAVLISRVNTTYLNDARCLVASENVVNKAKRLKLNETHLPWIDDDIETKKFVDFWFAKKQSNELRKLVTIIDQDYTGKMQDFLRVAASRMIVTKEQKASLARDTAHSRPHRVSLKNDFDVYSNFVKSSKTLAGLIPKANLPKAQVSIADSRHLSAIQDSSIDAVITSPPYLNAIDYMRGSKLALIWFGFKLSELRQIRSVSVGAEKKPEENNISETSARVASRMSFYNDLGSREQGIFIRYVSDMQRLMQEIRRVVKPGGLATLVVGNSCIKGIFIRNTDAVIKAGEICGMKLISRTERELPENRRYLPISSLAIGSSLSRRMRTEAVLTFKNP